MIVAESQSKPDVGGTLQQAYTRSGTTQPKITLTASGGGFTVRDASTPIGASLFTVSNNAGTVPFLDVQAGQVDVGNLSTLGPTAPIMRFQNASSPTQIWPGTLTFTSFPGNMMQYIGTMTHNYVNVRLGALSLQGTMIHQQAGFGFNHYLLFNNGMTFRNAASVAVNFGPGQSFIDQPQILADGAAISMSQLRSFLSQPNFNTTGGGTLAVTTFSQIQLFGQIQSGVTVTIRRGLHVGNLSVFTGTLTTEIGIEIDNLSDGGTVRGIRSAISAGAAKQFIEHTGTAISTFAGGIYVNNSVPLGIGTNTGNHVTLTRTGAGIMTMAGVGGSNNENLIWNFESTANNVRVSTGTSSGFTLDLGSLVFGDDPAIDPTTGNWNILLNPPARTITVGGDFARTLFSSTANVTVNAAMSQLATFILNEPGVTIGSGSVVDGAILIVQTSVAFGTNRYGVLISSNPTGGTINRALRVSGAAGVRIDGVFEHTGSTWGIFSATPATQPAAYTILNPSALRTLDVAAGTLSDCLRVLGTLLADNQTLGIVG